MTALDCLSYLDEIKICTGYEVNGKVIDYFPTTPTLKKCKPVFKTMKGRHCDIKVIKNHDELPQETKDYVEFIERQIGFPITMVSNGPEREAIIYRNK